jgi:K+-transporting ATPase ATPase C chain
MPLAAAARFLVVSLLLCSMLYPLAILAVGQAAVPASAQGHLVADPTGTVIGSRQLAQKFETAPYLWPRPSAADYKGDAASGSNLATTNPALRERAEAMVAAHGATAANPLPAELATASGAGLDPHLSLGAALYQAPRIAAARGVTGADIGRIIETKAQPQPLSPGTRLVNVLEANLALDAAFPLKGAGA